MTLKVFSENTAFSGLSHGAIDTLTVNAPVPLVDEERLKEVEPVQVLCRSVLRTFPAGSTSVTTAAQRSPSKVAPSLSAIHSASASALLLDLYCSVPGETSSPDWITICTAEISPDRAPADVEGAPEVVARVVVVEVAVVVVGVLLADVVVVELPVAGAASSADEEHPVSIRAAAATTDEAAKVVLRFVITR